MEHEPIKREGSSLYLVFPTKYKYCMIILGVIIAIICYKALEFLDSIPFNRSPDPLTLNPSNYDYSNKVILITGGNTGIGTESAKILSLTSATIILGCNSIKRGNIAKKDILKYNNYTNKNIFVMTLDLGSISEIDDFVTRFKSKYSSLDILIANAAIGSTENGMKTKDGLEIAFGFNHIGHMHLIMELKDLLNDGDISRVIMVSAVRYHHRKTNQMFHINDLNDHSGWDAYMNSKMCNIMFAKEFAKRYPLNEDNRILMVSLHPGVGKTYLFKNEQTEQIGVVEEHHIVFKSIFNVFFRFYGDTVQQLSYTPIYLSLMDTLHLVHGANYRNQYVREMYGQDVDKLYNDKLCQELWDKSVEIINTIRQSSVV